jgi:hypothetical protein
MSNKTYTAAEVEALIAAERAKSSKASTKSVEIRKATRVSKATGAPYTGIFVEGPFRPFYLPMSVANAILQNSGAFETAVKGAAKDESKALSTSVEPRIAVKS